jgi:hypothetical protein
LIGDVVPRFSLRKKREYTPLSINGANWWESLDGNPRGDFAARAGNAQKPKQC